MDGAKVLLPGTGAGAGASVTLGGSGVVGVLDTDGRLVLPDGKTVEPGQAVTVDGTVVSLGTGRGEVVVNSKTMTVAPTGGEGGGNQDGGVSNGQSTGGAARTASMIKGFWWVSVIAGIVGYWAM